MTWPGFKPRIKAYAGGWQMQPPVYGLGNWFKTIRELIAEWRRVRGERGE